MDPLSQAALGAAAAQSRSTHNTLTPALWIGALAGMAPDLDVFIRSGTDPLLFLEFHRQFTHSLLFIPIGALLCTAAFYPWARKRLRFGQVYLFALLGYATHGLLDACTTYGTQLFWPITDHRYAWHNVSVIDPLFTLPLLGLVIISWRKQRPALASAGLIWALGYLGAGALQHHRALSSAEQWIAEQGITPERLEVKPSFGNIVVWKLIYEVDGVFFVDAIRAGVDIERLQGDRIKRLDLTRDFHWLKLSSQQAQDVERFRWFSDDWLAVDGDDPQLIVDMRYSTLPNSTRALWGIRLDPDKTQTDHIDWTPRQRTNRQEVDTFLAMITGRRDLPWEPLTTRP